MNHLRHDFLRTTTPRKRGKLLWGTAGERAVRPHGVVIDTPRFDRSLGARQADKPVLVQTLVAKLPVEALDVRVLDRLARSNETQLDAARIRPHIERPSRKLGPVVDDNRLRESD